MICAGTFLPDTQRNSRGKIGGIDALLALEAQVPGLELIEEQKKLALSEEFR